MDIKSSQAIPTQLPHLHRTHGAIRFILQTSEQKSLSISRKLQTRDGIVAAHQAIQLFAGGNLPQRDLTLATRHAALNAGDSNLAIIWRERDGSGHAAQLFEREEFFASVDTPELNVLIYNRRDDFSVR